MRKLLFTSESVSPGHPDKLCDYIADYIKDFILVSDPQARVAIEVSVTTQLCILMGEVTTSAEVPYEQLALEAISNIGYTHPGEGFDVDNVKIHNFIHAQSADIALGTNEEILGAGDQGIIFGYACSETRELVPISWKLSRDLTNKMWELSLHQDSPLRPDAKAQVTVIYEDGEFKGIDTIVCSCSHSSTITQHEVKDIIIKQVIRPVLEDYGLFLDGLKLWINPTGAFSIYGPNGDTGLTGRKLVVDQYGGHSCVGGGTMQGKDPTKVDNSAALMARFLAKLVVSAELATKCQVQLSYAIGVQKPVSININTFGTSKVPEQMIEDFLIERYDCSPKAIINRFKLREPIMWSYANCSAHGWFGNTNFEFPWEQAYGKELSELLVKANAD